MIAYCGQVNIKKKQQLKRSPFKNIKLKNGEQTPSTGGSLQKHHSHQRPIIPRVSTQNKHIHTHSEGHH